MLVGGTRRAEKFISSRRMQEERIGNLNSKLKEEFHLKELAKFENKGKEVAQGNYVKMRLTELRHKHQQNIEFKRQKLKDLLEGEDQQYKYELKNLEDTPEQVREKMIQRVEQLKTRKETERQAFVEKQLERRFREGADELRKVDSELNELKNMHLRNIQMMEKQHLMERQYLEDMIYAELWERDRIRKERAEQEEIAVRKLKNEERNMVLNWQKQQNEQQRLAERAKIESEKRMLKDNWKQEAVRQKEQEQRTFEFNKELNKELFEHNIAQRSIKDEALRLEKDQDKKMIDSIVEKERMLDYLEREYKERQRRETREFLLNFKNRKGELNTQEAELERLIHEEMERQYRKQQEQWQKEEDARIKLMYEVYGSRADDIHRKQQSSKEENAMKLVERDRVTKDILDYEDELRRRKEEEYMRNKAHQTTVVHQVSDKRGREKQALQDKMAQEKADILAHVEYMKRVQQEKEKGKAMLEDLRKQRPF